MRSDATNKKGSVMKTQAISRTMFVNSVRAALSLGMLIAAPAMAGTSTASLAVSSAVAINCTVSTASVAFGSYDPVSTNAASGADLDGTGTLNVACTKGATVTADLSNGANVSGTQRRLANGVNFLNYDLYRDSGRTLAWTSGAGNNVNPYAPSATATTNAATNVTVYGRIPKGQDAASGSYSDTVTVTLNF